MSVLQRLAHVIQMLTAQTVEALTAVLVNRGLLEMEQHVKVSVLSSVKRD